MVKQEHGITTSSVIIYIIAITFVISALSIISGYFTKQISTTLSKGESSKAYTTFMSYFTQDIQEKGNGLKEINTQSKTENGVSYFVNYITFTNNNQYIYYGNNKSIYKNDVKICENVDVCSFSSSDYGTNKTLIEVDFRAGGFNKTSGNAMKFYI